MTTTADRGPGRRGAERRHLTVLFCDLVGSTAMSTRLDPEELNEIIGAYRRCCVDVVGRARGFIAQYLGDGVLVYFGYPRASEDDAERAVSAGLALVEAVSKQRDDTGAPMRSRVGIASGLVLAGDLVAEGATREHDVVGETPNLAARLQVYAEPNTVIISGETRRLIGELFECRPLGDLSLKGFATSLQAWRVIGANPAVSRFKALRTPSTPLADRVLETDLMMRRWQQAKAGNGCVLLISGEPGIGKSRIVQALLSGLVGEPHVRVRCYCAPTRQDSALYPVIAQLQRAASLERDDTTRQKLDKLETTLAQATADFGRSGSAHRRAPFASHGRPLSVAGP